MKTCTRCGRTKIDTFFFTQFYTEDMSLYTSVYDVCKKCANELKSEAVNNYVRKNNTLT